MAWEIQILAWNMLDKNLADLDQLMESASCPSDNWLFQPLYIYKQTIKSLHGSVIK
jgi:hypothetical protein